MHLQAADGAYHCAVGKSFASEQHDGVVCFAYYILLWHGTMVVVMMVVMMVVIYWGMAI